MWLLPAVWVLSLSIGKLSAQEVNVQVQQFGIEDGLLHRDVNVFKDSKGFLWLSSPAGLQRYDGYNFKTYALDGFEEFQIHRILETRHGEFLLLNRGGRADVVFFDPESGKVIQDSRHYDPVRVAEFRVLIGAYDDVHISGMADAFYFSTIGKITAFSFDQGRYEIPVAYSKKFLVSFTDTSGKIRIKTHRSNQSIDIEAASLLPLDWPWADAFDPGVTRINGELYFVEGALEVNATSIVKVDSLGKKEVVCPNLDGYRFHQFVGNRAWWQGNAGWKVVDLITGKIIELPKNQYGPELFGYVAYKWFYADGPYRSYTSGPFGFNIIDFQPNLFKTYFNTDSPYELPFANSIRGIYADTNRLYFSCENQGLISQPLDSPEAYNIFIDRNSGTTIPVGLLRDGENNFWASGRYSFQQYDSLFNLREVFQYDPKLIKRENFLQSWTLYEDEDACIWSGGLRGMQRVCDGQIERFKYNSAEDRHVLQILPKDDQTLWLCSEEGLLEFDLQTKAVSHTYGRGQAGEYAMPATNIRAMHVEPNGDRWLASDRGLIHWSATNGEKRLFNRIDGLVNENLYAVYSDDYNRLWLSSDYGIMSFDKTSLQVTSYLPKDGIGQTEFNRVSHYQTDDGRIYFGGLNGVTSFHPDDFEQTEREHLPVLLSEAELFDGQEEALVDKMTAINRTKEIYFQPADRFLKLAFTLPTFEGSDRILYGWKLEGVYDDWTYQKDNSLQFASLPYGSHLLRIKGQSSWTGWSPDELTVTIHMIKPIYLRTWFVLLTLLLLTAGIVAFFRLRTKLLKREIAKATLTIEQQAEDLRKLGELKSRFFANVSHELRTPLSLMLGPIKRLSRRTDQPAEVRKLLGFLERNTIHLRGLVNEILDLSRLENNKLALQQEPTTMLPFLKKHLSQFYSMGDSEQIMVTSDFSLASDLTTLLDRNKFEKILNNLLSNALKFTLPEGEVTISASATDAHLHFTVSDTGRGIHSEDLAHVFDRFYQSGQIGVPVEGGTGIGLSMVKELTELMGGRVWAESTLGVGSRFHVELPLLLVPEGLSPPSVALEEKQAVGEEVVATTTPANGAQAKKTASILIAEDNRDLREYYQILLTGYDLTLAENGAEALKHLTAGLQPDLIISDLMMPIMDGMTLLNRLKGAESWCHIPVIMLTAKTNHQVKIKALRYGIDDYVNKPFDDEELLVRIANLLDHQERRSGFLRTEAETERVASPDLHWLAELESYILENLREETLSVAAIATRFSVSESTLLRQLKRLTGLTPNRYLREIRLNRAKDHLLAADFSTVAEVAYEVGFADPTAFSRSFKQRFGLSPTAITV